MTGAIISIGDELALGQVVDTNAPWLAERLAEQGVFCPVHIVVPDDQSQIVRALRQLDWSRTDLVVVTGGLGPTDDDLTRQALAELLGVELVEDKPSVKRIEEFFSSRGREMPGRNRLQALCPRGATALDNPVGTAPGIRVTHGRGGAGAGAGAGAEIFCVPGVPSEMKMMFERYVAPFIASRGAESTASRRVILSAKINTFGAGESTVADLLGELMDRTRNPLVGTTVSRGIISVRIRATFDSRSEAEDQMERTAALVRERLGSLIFGTAEQTLADAVGEWLSRQGATLATAESCTGGLLGTMVTDVPGSSRYYLGGYVTYSNGAKMRDLNVPQVVLAEHGAVSGPVAKAMADGALARCGSDYALSITGIAGPDGGTLEKPAGTVWIGLARRSAETVAERHLMVGDRAMVRDRSAKTALNMLRLNLLGGE